MKKLKYLIASFSVLLLLIPSVIFADGDPEPEEDPESDLGYVDPYGFYQYGDLSELDSYFYNNFVLLPYLESDGSQYINSGIKASNNIDVDVYYSDFIEVSNSAYLYGVSYYDRYMFGYHVSNDNTVLKYFYNNLELVIPNPPEHYHINHQYNRGNVFYLNEYELSHPSQTFESEYNIGIFCSISNYNGSYLQISSAKIYYFSIYDNAANNGEGELVRSFYPARSKSNGTYGLYDSVTKTLYTSAAVGHPFENPEGSDAQLGLMSRIQLYIGTAVSSIGEILYFASAQPMILFFLAIGLAGVVIRWARRVVHF